MGSLSQSQLEELVRLAGEILDAASVRFREGIGAPSAVNKGGRDFATALDLELEKQIGGELRKRTGIPVLGEEFGHGEKSAGGVPPDLLWVLDPIDGTLNYSAGLPMAGILLALLDNREPVAGLTWLPMLNEKFVALSAGCLIRNGKDQPRLERVDVRESIIALGSFNLDSAGVYPGEYRQEVIGEISRVCSRLRLQGCTGADLAYTAAGSLGAAISFGHHVWDHAAGAALVRAAGGIVTDLHGNPWEAGSPSLLAASPGVHEQLIAIIRAVNARTGFTQEALDAE
ncbi:inositol monophosphatase family protein [Hoyosella subflava]|uniref:inositol-phosphate phosphatase n=1 Tax=Hoyosella subflava (strain DSM 45089 / JCM 17490 / NBRC 109087 / DQS3-9A1) TaxID=443218 RepID=F6EH60_HOYSD|nr:inositol monophosphatase family protein [Hoyosella subflava]AEF39897.1 Inositol monophosphatase [Hoyosella subflava DQS3-9A1]